MKVTWLFKIGANHFLSFEDYTYNLNSYEGVIDPNTFSGITENSSSSAYELISSSDLTIGARTSDLGDLTGSLCNIYLLVDDVLSKTWLYKIKHSSYAYGLNSIWMENIFSSVLEGIYPNTKRPEDIWPTVKETPSNTYVIPKIFGNAFIPLRSVYDATQDDRFYVLGPSSYTYSVDMVKSPKDWSNQSTWDDTYSYPQQTLNGYKVLQALIWNYAENVDMEPEIANGIWRSGDYFYDMPARVTSTEIYASQGASPADVLYHILKDMLLSAGLGENLLDSSSFANAKATYSSWGVKWDGGIYEALDRQKILSSLLSQCNSILKVTDKIYLLPISTSIQKTFDISSIKRNSYSFSPSWPEEIDGGYIEYIPTFNTPQDRPYEHIVGYLSGQSSVNKPTTDRFKATLIHDSVVAQKLGILYYNKIYDKKGSISFSSIPNKYNNALIPGQYISINDSIYGSTHNILIESITYNRDLSLNIQGTEYLNGILGFGSISATNIYPPEDSSTYRTINDYLHWLNIEGRPHSLEGLDAEASARVTNIMNIVDGIASDGLLSVIEKKQWLDEWNLFVAQATVITDQAQLTGLCVVIGDDPSNAVEYNDWYTSTVNLYNYMAPMWADMENPSIINDDPLNPTEFQDMWGIYAVNKEKLLAKINQGFGLSEEQQLQLAAANQLVSDISSDSVFSAAEKAYYYTAIATAYLEYPEIIAKAQALDLTLETVYTTFVSNSVALDAYLQTIANWEDLTVSSYINPTTFNALWNHYFLSRQQLLNVMYNLTPDQIGQLNAASQFVTDVTSDSVFSAVEKAFYHTYISTAYLEYPEIIAKAQALDLTLETVYTTFVSNSVALDAYLQTIANWEDLTVSSTIDPTTFNTLWNNYFLSRQQLLNVIYNLTPDQIGQLNAANQLVSDISSDSVFSAAEKAYYYTAIATAYLEYTEIIARANDLNLTADSKYTTFVSAGEALDVYLATIANWDDLTVSSTIDPTTFNTLWNNYFVSRQKLLNRISVEDAKLANFSQLNDDNGRLAQLNADVEAANAVVAGLVDDGIITSVEKKGIIPSYQSAVNDYLELHNTAVTLGINTTAFIAAGEAVNTAMKPIFGTDLSDNIDYHLLGEDYSLIDNGKSRQWFTNLWATYWNQWSLLNQAIDCQLNADVEAANAFVAGLVDDSIITSVEKKGIIPSYQSAINDYFQLYNTAITLGINTTAFVAAGEAVHTAMKPIFGTNLSDIIDYHLLGEDYSLTDNGKSRQWFTDLWAAYWNQWSLLKQAIDYMSGGSASWPNILGVPPELASVSEMQDILLNSATTMAENETRLPGLTFSVSNFNARNDRITEVPANPIIATDGTAIDYLYNSNGTANINIAWSYGTGTPATDIDGFIVHIKQSSSATAIDLTVDLSSASHYQILPHMRDYTVVGLTPGYYYTVGVEAFRVVDPDINSNGILRSAIIQPTIVEENPIFLSHTVPAPSTVTLTII